MSKYARYHARRRQDALREVDSRLVCNLCATPATETRLQIDHVHNDGHAERKAYGNAAFISHIIRGTRPPDFGPLQLLCPPCHDRKTEEAST